MKSDWPLESYRPRKRKWSEYPRASSGRNAALLGVAITLAVSVPTTIEKIPDPTARSLVTLLAILLVLGAGYLMRQGE